MRFSIMAKILILLLVVTVIPLGLLGYLAVNDINSMSQVAGSNARQMGATAVKDSTESLNALGADMIKQEAIMVAKQLEIYIKAHPTMTVAQLQNDSYFNAIAVQPVGKLGYTAITDVNTLYCRWHANPKIANSDLHNLAGKLPGFWSVMVKSQGGVVSYGYYDWLDPDNSTKQKYMYIAIVNATTADGVRLSVAATTYISEFNAPAKTTETKLNSAVSGVISNIETSAASIQTQTTTLIVITCLVVLLIGLLFAGSITMPLNKLTKAGNKIAEGKTETEIPKIKSNDEIEDLGNTMQMLSGALNFLKNEQKSKKK